MSVPAYTITAARYLAADNLAAELATLQRGVVHISQADTPVAWAHFLEWIGGDHVVTPFAPLARRRRRQIAAVAGDITDWIAEGATQADRLTRLGKVASVALGVQLLADPTLGPTLGIPVAGDEPDV